MLGPVFARELAVTARRGRAYALRFAYGLALLAVLVAGYRQLDPTRPVQAQVSQLAGAAFRNLMLVQGLAAIFLTPALVAGAIAGEVQRKTLGDLLTSDLSATEIVIGKLAARLLHVGVLVVASLPVLLLTGLLGGFGLPWCSCSVAATLSTAFFLGGLSILGSTQTRSVRGAMNFVFTLALTWLILPGATTHFSSREARGVRAGRLLSLGRADQCVGRNEQPVYALPRTAPGRGARPRSADGACFADGRRAGAPRDVPDGLRRRLPATVVPSSCGGPRAKEGRHGPRAAARAADRRLR